MKKYLNILIVLLVAFVASSAYAENGFFPSREDKLERMEERREAWEDKKEDKMERREIFGRPFFNFKPNSREMILNGMTMRAENLKKLADKFLERIDSLEDKHEDLDATATKNLIANAKNSIDDAQEHLADAKQAIENEDSIAEIRTHIAEAKEDMKQAHNFLSQAVQEIMKELKEEDAEDNN